MEDRPYAEQANSADYQQGMTTMGDLGGPQFMRRDLERTRELMALAQSIATQIKVQVPPGRERSRLRQMVEMFLDE